MSVEPTDTPAPPIAAHPATPATLDELRARLLALLNVPNPWADPCQCQRCREVIDAFGVQTCETCGYRGTFYAERCCCYDSTCLGGPYAGSGCPHGSICCPVCAEGDADYEHWELLKAIRALLPPPTTESQEPTLWTASRGEQ